MSGYIEMALEDAVKLFKGKKGTVLVSVQDLEKDEIVDFVKKTKEDCVEVIKNAATITQACDDFMKQLNVYSHKQADIRNILPLGKVKIICMKNEKK